MHKQVVKADVPDAGATFNHCVRYGNMIYVSGLPPFHIFSITTDITWVSGT